MTEIIYGSNDFKEPKLVRNGLKDFLSCNCTSGTFQSKQRCRALVTKNSNRTAHDFDLLFVFVDNL